MPFAPPETRYAQSGDVNIAYQVVGEAGSTSSSWMGWVSHLDYFWEEPSFARFFRRLASFSRMILFDKRGTGLFDGVRTRAADARAAHGRVRAVMDAVGSERAALVGGLRGRPTCPCMPPRIPSGPPPWILLGAYPRRLCARLSLRRAAGGIRGVVRGVRGLGRTRRLDASAKHPPRPTFPVAVGDFLRMSASPGAACTLTRMNSEIDAARRSRPSRAPTLVIHRTGDARPLPVGGARYMAERCRAPPSSSYPATTISRASAIRDAILDEVEEFLTGVRQADRPRVGDRAVHGHRRLHRKGGRARGPALAASCWNAPLQVRRELDRFRGREIETAGDGFLATFDGPARRSAAPRDTRRGAALGLGVRAGLHTGECRARG